MLEMQNQCAEIKLRAERKGGELLDRMEKSKGGRPARTGSTMLPVSTLKSIGLDKFQSSRWQAIASIPKKDFERHIEEAKAKPNGELTTAALLKQARADKGRKSTDEKPTFSFAKLLRRIGQRCHPFVIKQRRV